MSASDIDSLELLHSLLMDTENQRQKSMCGVVLCFLVKLSGNIELRGCRPVLSSALGNSSLKIMSDTQLDLNTLQAPLTLQTRCVFAPNHSNYQT